MKLRANVIASRNTTIHCGAEIKASQPAYLEIVQDDRLYFLFRMDRESNCIADTCHTSLDEAKSQADFEYELSPEGWQETGSKN